MIGRLLNLLQCSHDPMSRVFTIRDKNGKRESYRVCLECGFKRRWNWEGMFYESSSFLGSLRDRVDVRS